MKVSWSWKGRALAQSGKQHSDVFLSSREFHSSVFPCEGLLRLGLTVAEELEGDHRVVPKEQ